MATSTRPADRPARRNGRPTPDLDLHSAALDSPLLRESWSVGAPLNWLEFITGCKPGGPAPPPRPRATADDGG